MCWVDPGSPPLCEQGELLITLLFHIALHEAAVRFEELKAQKELRQLQEDKKNDKKPPPYKHIKVRASEGGQVQKRSPELSVQVISRYTETFLLFGHLATFEGYFGPLGIFSHLPQKQFMYLQSCVEAEMQ